MKLIKINTDHYVIVDDSGIDYDSEPYLLIKDDYETYIRKHKGDSKPTTEHYKITHSTQPIDGDGTGACFIDIKQLPIQEVKELIGEVDVEEKANQYLKNNYPEYLNPKEKMAVIEDYKTVYNQALEDNKEKKYTEMDMKKAFYKGIDSYMQNGDAIEVTIKDFRESLQPKTEWNVEFIDGKLKLNK